VTAPDTKALSKFYGTFDAAQMQQIKIDLAAVGVDLDAPKLPAMLEKPWWLPGNVTTPRDAIQAAAWHFGLQLDVSASRPRTVKQQVAVLTETLAACTAALDWINRVDMSHDHTYWLPARMFLRSRIERRAILQGALTAEIIDLKGCIAGLNTLPSTSAANAKTMHGDYWRELARLWLALKPRISSRLRPGHLRRFLLHGSAPLFANMENIEGKIDAFVHRFLREQTKA
jgi:hypothetical protein